MADKSPLDIAHHEMEENPEDVTARLRFFERLADCELFLMLECAADGDTLSPKVVEADGAQYVLVFDREERLAEFVGDGAHHAALSGRVVAAMLTGKGIGLGLNLGVAPSSFLVPADAVDWLREMLDTAPDEVTALPRSIDAPKGLPETLFPALDTKLASAAGIARTAYLVSVTYNGGRRGHMLAIIGALPAAHGALAKAVNEALVFSGIEAGELDVAFLTGSEPMCKALEKVD